MAGRLVFCIRKTKWKITMKAPSQKDFYPLITDAEFISHVMTEQITFLTCPPNPPLRVSRHCLTAVNIDSLKDSNMKT
jgi:hypothetical protein